MSGRYGCRIWLRKKREMIEDFRSIINKISLWLNPACLHWLVANPAVVEGICEKILSTESWWKHCADDIFTCTLQATPFCTCRTAVFVCEAWFIRTMLCICFMLGFVICKAKLICFQWCLDLQTTLCLIVNCTVFVKHTVCFFKFWQGNWLHYQPCGWEFWSLTCFPCYINFRVSFQLIGEHK